MKASAKKIPEALIYEMVNGKPIYYRRHKEYLSGSKQLDELRGSSYLQALIGIHKIMIANQGEDWQIID